MVASAKVNIDVFSKVLSAPEDISLTFNNDLLLESNLT